ncbi:MAG: SDR family NAD(P)-dependent oxidoreductase [Janthinobacterium lividum]
MSVGRFDDRVAVITGAASGIGRATAVAFAERGADIVVGTFPGDPHDPAGTVAAVEAVGGRAVVGEVDVRVSTQVDALAQQALDTYGRIDYAVANAGVLRAAPLADLSDDAWESVVGVDLTGVVRTFRSCSPHLVEGGAMVAVSSIAGGVYGWADHAHYGAAKAGVKGLCSSLAVELAPRGIRVNCVIPGLIETPQSLDAVNSYGPDGLAAAGQGIPLQRVGRADEIASVIRFLCSTDASYLTGQSVIVDGGLTVRMPS